MDELIKQLNILYEDDQIAVIDKPAGLVVNDADTQKEPTLQTYLKQLKWPVDGPDGAEESFYKRNGIVHRIDKETSGALVLAKTLDAFLNLQAQFKSRMVHKKYIALVFGKVGDLKPGEEVTIDAPIGRNPRNRERFAIVAGGRESVTIVKLLEVLGPHDGQEFSLIECYPQTGRTHQIRVHMTAMENPVAGDKVYSGRQRIKRYKGLFPRQFLHASSIEFLHPETNRLINITSPLPEDMRSVLDSLKK